MHLFLMGVTLALHSANVMSNDVSFASPTAIWRSPWRLEPFPSAQKEGALPYFDVSFTLFVLVYEHTILRLYPAHTRVRYSCLRLISESVWGNYL